MLVSLVYVIGRRLFELILLLARGDRSKELEIVVLRHELSILRRQVARPRLSPRDRLLLAILRRVLPRRSWCAFFVTPQTLLRWHRQLVRRRWTYPQQSGRPPLDPSIRALILRLARENSELRSLGICVSGSYVRNVLIRAGVPPAPERDGLSWRSFRRRHAASIVACDFFAVETAALQRLYVLFFISLATRRLEYIACTTDPDSRWTTQQARNLVMQFDDQRPTLRYLVHDRESKFSHRFDGIFVSEGVTIMRTPARNRRQLERVLRVYVHYYNEHRPHRASTCPRRHPSPLRRPAPCPPPAYTRIERRDRLGGLLHELPGRGLIGVSAPGAPALNCRGVRDIVVCLEDKSAVPRSESSIIGSIPRLIGAGCANKRAQKRRICRESLEASDGLEPSNPLLTVEASASGYVIASGACLRAFPAISRTKSSATSRSSKGHWIGCFPQRGRGVSPGTETYCPLETGWRFTVPQKPEIFQCWSYQPRGPFDDRCVVCGRAAVDVERPRLTREKLRRLELLIGAEQQQANRIGFWVPKEQHRLHCPVKDWQPSGNAKSPSREGLFGRTGVIGTTRTNSHSRS